jgi:hypothetical protein
MSSTDNGVPRWLEAVRSFERTIGVPVERFVTSEAYFDLLPHLHRTQEQVEELVAGATDRWYRLLNLPSGSDVRQLREQLSRLERQVEKLTKQLADRESAPAARTRRAPAKTD